MNRIVVLAMACVLLGACEASKKKEVQDADTTKVTVDTTASMDNKLTDAQKAEGWKLLFNGRNTEGWRFYKNKENNSWEVADGALHCKPFDGNEKRSDIMTTEQYENFDLSFDWKVSRKGNSGVMFRVTEDFDEPFFSGPEYQVIDDKEYPGELTDLQLTGANYDMHAPPADKPVNPVGQWNTSRLAVNGNHVEHWLNGAKVVEYDLNSADWKSRKNKSKWKDAKGYGIAKKGYIDFQDHGAEVWFKNIMIKTL
jgi:hypothetical protein